MLWWITLILGVVEGLTEFLPVSSTGHQIIVADALGFRGTTSQAFNIFIQLGAIMAVVWEYKAKLWFSAITVFNDKSSQHFVTILLVGFIPAACFGLAFSHWIHQHLFNPITVALALIVGGVVMIWIEGRHHSASILTFDKITLKKALQIGLAQCLALFPGASRSAATIVGGMWFGLDRRVATEFSFFLAIPTMMGATCLSMYHYRHDFQWDDAASFALGFITAFLVAKVSIGFLLQFVSRHSYRPFGWYRIVFGLFVLLSWQQGWIIWTPPS